MHYMHKNIMNNRPNPQDLFCGSVGMDATCGALATSRDVSHMHLN